MPDKNEMIEKRKRALSGGLLEEGNIDLSKRPVVKNPDGSISTIKSISVNFDGKETLIPTISPNGRKLTDEEAIDLYRRTGKHLGKFRDVKSASSYAREISKKQGERYK